MQSALIGSILLSISACPIGVYLILRGMSLTGDAISHAILPGVAAAFLFCGFSLISMTLGGILAGVIVALATALISRNSFQKEDASMTVFYLIALAAGVIIVSLKIQRLICFISYLARYLHLIHKPFYSSPLSW